LAIKLIRVGERKKMIHKRKLKRLYTIIFVIALCAMIITSSFVDIAESSKKRRRKLRKAADAIADANSKINLAGDVLAITGGLAGQPEVVAAGGVLKEIAYYSFLAAYLLRLLAKFVFCDLPGEPTTVSLASTPTIRSVIAEGLALSPQNITHAPPGACISVYGEGFDTNKTGNHVTFDTENATVSLSNSTWLRVTVPYNLTGSVSITVTTSSGTSPPFAFTVDPLASPPEPIGSTTSEFLDKQKQALPLVKSEVEQVSLEEPQAFTASGVNKTQLIKAIDTELSLISQFETGHYQNLSALGWPLYKMDAIIVAWPPDEEAEMDALLNELRTEDEWPMFRYNIRHTGSSSSTAPSTNKTLWTCATSGGVWSSPSVAEGRVFVYGGNTFYALNETTGAVLWNYPTIYGLSGQSPAFLSSKVIQPLYGKVSAFNATTGMSVWNYTLSGGDWVTSSVTVAYGMVFFGSNLGKLYALNGTTGAFKWANQTGGQVSSTPAVVDGTVFFGSSDRKVYALNSSTGNVVWTKDTGGDVYSSPAVVNGRVFVGTGAAKIYALNQTNGTPLWFYPASSSSSPAVYDGKVFIGSVDHNVYALDEVTGARQWNRTTGGSVSSSPAVADGKVFIGSSDKKIYCFNATDGSVIWTYTTGGNVASSPAVADGLLFIGSGDNNVYAFGLLRDISITAVVPSKTVIGQGFNALINVTVVNQGDLEETFTVSTYANKTLLASQKISLSKGNSTTVTFTWNTTGFVKGNYTIWAYAWPVQGETDTTDNTFTDSWVIVVMVGDITGPSKWPDGKVDMRDVGLAARYFGQSVPPAPANCDINNDGKIDMKDVGTVARHFGEKDP
jgi:outer membrane protein assembly factor BamB